MSSQRASESEKKRILYCIIPKYYSIISTLLSVFEFILEIMGLARAMDVGCRHTVAVEPKRANRVS